MINVKSEEKFFPKDFIIHDLMKEKKIFAKKQTMWVVSIISIV